MAMMCVICHNINFQTCAREKEKKQRQDRFANAIFSVPSQSGEKTRNVIIQGISQNDTILLILLRLNSHYARLL
jgi:hypothetical protein